MRTSFLFTVFFNVILAGSIAAADTGGWTSTDVGAVTAAGSASETNGVWTISGDGADIWGTADAFQFVHRTLTEVGVLTVRVLDMQNTNTFAKVGLMFRSSTAPDAATFLLDIRPTGDVEMLARMQDGASMSYIGGTTLTLPAYLRLEHTFNGGTSAWTSQDGEHWTMLREEVPVSLGRSFEAGVAVTSHAPGQLNRADVDHLNLDVLQPAWASVDVGDVSVAGSAAESEAGWTVSGAGNDIWGPADSFHFVYRTVRAGGHIVVRVDDLQNTQPFAKAGIMLRSSLDAAAPMVVVDVKPDGAVEFMARSGWGEDVMYLGGVFPPPVHRWLDIAYRQDGTSAIVTVQASPDKVNWSPLGPPAVIPWSYMFDAGLAVTSHVSGVLNTAHFAGLSVLEPGVWSDDIGDTGLVGRSAITIDDVGSRVVQGAGADIWGSADSFTFVHGPADTAGNVHALTSRIASLTAAHPFAKAGFMFRESLDPDAAQVILDVKPDGGVEFMARLCAGCDTTFIGGTTMGLPVYLTLFRNGSTFSATAASGDQRTRTSLGSVEVPMAAPFAGIAVTSHDPAHIATAVFDNPPR